MDARDELRAELGREQQAENAAARAKRRAAEDKEQYEGEVQKVKNRLHEVAQLTVQALADSGEPPACIEVEPKPSGLAGLFRQSVEITGWRVQWRGSDAVVTQGESLFVRDGSVFQQKFRPYSFKDVIDQRLADIGAYRDDSGTNNLERAFEGHGSEGIANSLRSDLERVRGEIVRDFSRLLSSRGLSI